MYSPAFAHPLEEHNAARFLCIADVEESIELSQEERNRQEASTWASCGSPAIQLGMS